MAEIKLYIASSLDGYIARKDGDIEWLHEIPNPDNSDFGYTEFYKDIEVVIMGSTTYEQVMGFDVEWPYADRKCVVVSRREDLEISTPNTIRAGHITADYLDQLKAETNGHIWLIGGGKLIQSFLNLNAIDEILLTLVSRILGEGIPLFPSPLPDSHWRFSEFKGFNEAAVMLSYRNSDKPTA